LSSDGTVLAAGGPTSSIISPITGYVRVFKYASNTWTQLGSDIDGEAISYDGSSVSLSSDGTVLAVGGAWSNGDNSGRVRVYKYANGKWTQWGADINGEAVSDYFGCSVHLSSDGTVLAVGASGNDGKNGIDSGYVRVYQYNGRKKGWTQRGANIDGEAAGDSSGDSVSLSSDGTVLAVGASASGVNNVRSGHVRVYKFANSEWTQLGADIDGEADYDYFGLSVSLSSCGTFVAAGALYNDGENGVNSGHVRVYQFVNNAWTQLGADIGREAECDRSGKAVSLSSDGTIVAVGAPNNDGTSLFSSDRGHVRVYKYANSMWTQLGADIDGEADTDYFGASVSLSSCGTIVAAAAIYNEGGYDYEANAGHVRVYQITATGPSPQPTKKSKAHHQ